MYMYMYNVQCTRKFLGRGYMPPASQNAQLHLHVHVHVHIVKYPDFRGVCVCVCIIEGSSLSPSPAVCSAECADREGPTGREGTELARRHEREGRSCSAALCHTAAAATGTGTHVRTCIHVPDKLCVFPARRELTSSKQLLSRDCWLVWPHHDSFFS